MDSESMTQTEQGKGMTHKRQRISAPDMDGAIFTALETC